MREACGLLAEQARDNRRRISAVGAKTLQEDYASLSPKTVASVGKLLAERGEAFDHDLHDMLAATRALTPALPEFAVWMAEALVWARYAERDDAFFSAAARFIVSGTPELLDEAERFPHRFGPEKLRDSLAAFRRWYEKMEPRLASINLDPAHMIETEGRSLKVVEALKKKGEMRGVGAWLFPAPFKLLAIAHVEVWSNRALDGLVFPTGIQVERALSMLQKEGVITLERAIIGASSGSLADEFAKLWALQLPQQKLAHAASTSVLHINGALHELGDRGPGG
jgi:hypothetical protein